MPRPSFLPVKRAVGISARRQRAASRGAPKAAPSETSLALDNAALLLAPGGRDEYSTMTLAVTRWRSAAQLNFSRTGTPLSCTRQTLFLGTSHCRPGCPCSISERTIMKTTAVLASILALSCSIALAQGGAGGGSGGGSAGGSAGSGSAAGASGGATGTGSTSATTGMQGTTGTNVGGGVNSQQGVGSTPGTSTEGPNQGTTRPGSSGK